MKEFLSRIMAIVLVFGVLLTFMGGSDVIDSMKKPVDYETLLASDVKKNMIVEGDLYVNLGAYEEEYTTTNGVKTGSSKYSYLIPIGEEEFMGFKNRTDAEYQALEKQADAVYALLNGEDVEEPEPVHFIGKVKSLGKKEAGYMRSYLIDLGMTESEVDQYMLPYRIVSEDFSSGPAELIGGLVLLVIALVLFLLSRRQKEKETMNYAAQTTSASVNSTMSSDDLDAWMNQSAEGNTAETPETTTYSSDVTEAATEEADTSGYNKETFGEVGSKTGLKLK